MTRKLRARPSVASRFFKAHGLGNDYLVFDEGPGPVLSPVLARRICSRRRGVGADGIVVAEAVPPGAEARLRMFNPDGSEFERSGNGLRIAGVHLRRQGRASGSAPFPVRVGGDRAGGDRVRLEVVGPGADGAWDVRVDMGRARFPHGPPFVAPGWLGERGRVAFDLGAPRTDPSAPTGELAEPTARGRLIEAVPVAVGNPHAVIFGDGPPSDADVERLGPLVAAHEAFPEGANVQFAWVPEDAAPTDVAVHVEIWERGVGRTESSGTSACAAAVAAVREGRLPRGPVRVVMTGGAMEVDVGRDWSVRLRGPVEEVCEGELSAALLGSGSHSGLERDSGG